MLQWEHSAILLTFIKLPFVIKIFVLSIFEWRLKTGFTVHKLTCLNGVLQNPIPGIFSTCFHAKCCFMKMHLEITIPFLVKQSRYKALSFRQPIYFDVVIKDCSELMLNYIAFNNFSVMFDLFPGVLLKDTTQLASACSDAGSY